MEIKNKKAYFNYDLSDKETAGIILKGTEIKSIRNRDVNFVNSYCLFINGELWLRDLHISEYEMGNQNNHNPKRDRKLLLTKQQLYKFETKSKEKGFTLIPSEIFINDRGLVKVNICLARGKRVYDKKRHIIEEDIKRDMDRELKNIKI